MKVNNKLFFISIFLIFLCCMVSVSASEDFSNETNMALDDAANEDVVGDHGFDLAQIYVNGSSDNKDFSSADQGWDYAVNDLDKSVLNINEGGVIYVSNGEYNDSIGEQVKKGFKVVGMGDNVVIQPRSLILGSHMENHCITFENIIFKSNPKGSNCQLNNNFNFINCTFINFKLTTQNLIVKNQWAIPSCGYFEDNFYNCTFRDYYLDNTCIYANIASKLTFDRCSFENITADSIVNIDLSKASGGVNIENSIFNEINVNGVFDTTTKKSSCSFVNNTGEVTIFRPNPPKTNLVLEILDRYSFRSVLTDESGKPIKGAEIVWSFWGSLVDRLITDDDGVTVLTHTDTHENILVEAKYEGVKSLNLNYAGDVDSIEVDYPQFEKDTIFTYVTNESSVTFTLKNKLNTVIGNANVTYIVDGVESTAVTDGNGSFILNNLIGEVDVYVSYNGSDNYSASSDFFYLDFPKIKTQIIADNITVGYKKGKLSIVLKGNGKPLSNQTLYVVLNGKEYFPVTNNNGEATIDLSLTPNVYLVQIYYDEDAKHNASETKSLITVVDDRIKTSLTSKDITIAYGSDNNLIISFKANGKPLSNVKVNVNGQNKLTDKNGQITIVLSSLAPNNYNFKFSFEGNDIYAPSSGSAKVTVNKAPSKITAKKAKFKLNKKAKKYTIALTAGKKAVAKVKVTIKVGKKTYTAKTNAKGKATFNLKKLTKKGKYTAVIKFKGNKLYKATSTKAKIVIK